MTARNETVQLPVILPGSVGRQGEPRAGRLRGDARFAAQLLGAGGERRGLKGGPVVLNAAQAAYLHAQWSGLDDRRLPCGAMKRSRV